MERKATFEMVISDESNSLSDKSDNEKLEVTTEDNNSSSMPKMPYCKIKQKPTSLLRSSSDRFLDRMNDF